MRFILFPALLFLISFPAHSQTCIAGDPKDTQLVSIFNDQSNPDNGPIRLWRSGQAGQARAPLKTAECNDCRNHNMDALDELIQKISKGWATNPRINPECVAASMAAAKTGVMGVTAYRAAFRTVSADKNKTMKVPIPRPRPSCRLSQQRHACPIEALTCDREKGSAPSRKTSDVPCITREMAEYVSWILDQAVTCLSPEDDQIDRRTIVRKLNNEAQFLFMVDSPNGTGMQQLVPGAIKEMLAPERGYGGIIQPVADLLKEPNPKNPAKKKACTAFKDVIDRTPSRPIKGGASIGTCELVHPGIGVARSALLGIGNFAHVSYTYKVAGRNISADALTRKAGFNPASDSNARALRDYIALSYYSAAGPRGGFAVFDETSRALGCPRGKRCTSIALLNSFKKNMSAYYRTNGLPNYFNEIDERKAELLKRMDGAPPPGKTPPTYSTRDLEGDRCVQ